MKAAPVQLLQVFFLRTDIRTNEDGAPPPEYNPLQSINLLTGVAISVSFQFDMAPEPEPDGNVTYGVRLSFEMKSGDEEGNGRQAPYFAAVDANANVLLLKGARQIKDVDKIVRAAGAGLIWSAVREHVATLTARMPYGPVFLPAMTFADMFAEAAPQLIPAAEDRTPT